MNGQKSGQVNVVLMALVGVLVGFIGGYFIGQKSAPAGGVATAGLVAGQVPCPHALEAKDQWILAGYRCPGTETEQAALSTCHCPIAHGLEDRVKSALAGGKDGQAIRAELELEYASRLKFR